MDHFAVRVRDGQSFSIASRKSTFSTGQGTDVRIEREINYLRAINELRSAGPLSRVALAQRLRLSRTTISSIIDVLLNEGMVQEGQYLDAAAQGGRRAVQVHFNADAGRVLGIEMGRSHLTLLATNLAAEIVAQRTEPFDTAQGAAICLPRLIATARIFVEQAGLRWSHLIGIGLGMPGPLSNDLHRVSSAPRMPGWEQLDIWQTLHEAFQLPLLIDNDANMGALGESRYGAGRGHSHLAYIKIDTGIGGGLILAGTIYRGHNGSAGEIGHTTIDENGPPCACGNRGCLETVATVPAIVADAMHNHTHTAFMSTTPTTTDTAQEQRQITDVLQAAREGDTACIAALTRAGERIGAAIVNLINMFNPSVIVIDGSIARAGEVFFTTLQRVAETASLPAARVGLQIVPGTLCEKSVALGSAVAVIDEAFALPNFARGSTTARPEETRHTSST